MATALTTEQIVQKMYIGFYGRGADVDGLAYWVGKLGDNTDTTAIRESFSNSKESVTLFGGKTDTATVTAIYLQTFDRHPDASGLKFYKDALAANTMTKAEIAANIIDGAKGTDVAIVTNKLAVAELFTASMDTAVKKAAYAGDAAVIMARENLAKVDASTVVATFDFASSVNSMVTAAAAAAVAFDAAEVVYANAVTVYDNAVVTAAASTLAAATAAAAATAPTSVVLLTTFQTAAAAAVTDAAAVTAAAAAVTAAAAELITIPLLTVSRFIDDETAVTANNSALSYAAAASIAATAANGVKTAADDALVAQSGTDASATAEFDDAVVIHAAAVATYASSGDIA